MSEDSRIDWDAKIRQMNAIGEGFKTKIAPNALAGLERFAEVSRGLGHTSPTELPRPAAPPEPVQPTGPEPLTTEDIAYCFGGLRWTEDEWRKPLGDLPNWLKHCLVIPGAQGRHSRRWNPVLIGAELVRKKGVPMHHVRGKFQSKAALQPWLEAWKIYEADNFDGV